MAQASKLRETSREIQDFGNLHTLRAQSASPLASRPNGKKRKDLNLWVEREISGDFGDQGVVAFPWTSEHRSPDHGPTWVRTKVIDIHAPEGSEKSPITPPQLIKKINKKLQKILAIFESGGKRSKNLPLINEKLDKIGKFMAKLDSLGPNSLKIEEEKRILALKMKEIRRKIQKSNSLSPQRKETQKLTRLLGQEIEKKNKILLAHQARIQGLEESLRVLAPKEGGGVPGLEDPTD
eukprot:CAMPEP_0184300052 /NCGR_PEP_ID=MMETSP1049-20130417/10552_1 /TAXON_ID=77928 /ORGANISM="Proteomonas sulcata, Strain CCMP704" /LENGTH=236 /DNA_ID=CAMNT_0026610679 /DNA_START=198 /DNA_END=908 /DNA_ORIENTATION=+